MNNRRKYRMTAHKRIFNTPAIRSYRASEEEQSTLPAIEREAVRLGLKTEEDWRRSPDLRAWAKRNFFRRYVPEWYLNYLHLDWQLIPVSSKEHFYAVR